MPERHLTVDIEVAISRKSSEKSYVVIRDNAAGIPRSELAQVITPGGTSGGDNLNEHGLGMKQAVASGDLAYLVTKTSSDSHAVLIERFAFGPIRAPEIEVDWECGTEICARNLRPIVPTASQKYTMELVPYLGARYRRFLKRDNPTMTLTVSLFDLDTTNGNNEPQVRNSRRVEAVNPVYMNPKSRHNDPVVYRKVFQKNGWKAEFTLGYAAEPQEYPELGLPEPQPYMPYAISLRKQGFDVIKDDRVIEFHQLSQLGLAPLHNDYNLIRGEIDLKEGFVTEITKNRVLHDDSFIELVEEIRQHLEAKKSLKKKTFPGEIPERVYHQRLKTHLQTRRIDRKQDVKLEVPVEAMDGEIDVLADGDVYEMKTGRANGYDVYQLFGYLDAGGYDCGYLVAKDFSTGADLA